MINPLIALIGAIILGLPSISYHSAAYGKSFRTKKVASSLLIGQFILSVVMLITGLIGIFYGWLVLILSILLGYYFGYRFGERKKNSKKSMRKDSEVKVETIVWVMLAIFVGFLAVMQNVSPAFIEGDAYGRYLPWAKTIVETHGIPAVVEPSGLIGQFQLLFSPHYMHAGLALVFSILGTYSDSAVAAIPLFFSGVTFFFLLLWAQEKDKKAIVYLGPMLISSYAFLLMFHSILQEGPLLLFITLGLYSILLFAKDKTNFAVLLTAIAFSMTAQTKYNGLIFALLGFITLLILAKDKKQRIDILLIFFVTHIPSVMWMIRNYIHYNNPVYRQLNNVFSGKWNFMLDKLKPIRPTDNSVATSRFFRNIFIEFPAMIFSLLYVLKNWKKSEIRIFATFLIVFMITMPFFGLRLLTRYLTPFFGILALYGALMAAMIIPASISYLRKVFKRQKNSRVELKISNAIGIVLLAIGIAGVIYGLSISSSVMVKQNEWDSQKDIARYINENNELTYDGEKIVLWGEGSTATEWYSNTFIVTPDYNMYLIATNRTVIPYAETFINLEVVRDMEERGIRLAIPELTAKNYNEIAHQLGVDYIYDSTYSENTAGFQETNSLQMKPIYQAAENNPELFTLEYISPTGARLWSVK